MWSQNITFLSITAYFQGSEPEEQPFLTGKELSQLGSDSVRRNALQKGSLLSLALGVTVPCKKSIFPVPVLYSKREEIYSPWLESWLVLEAASMPAGLRAQSCPSRLQGTRCRDTSSCTSATVLHYPLRTTSSRRYLLILQLQKYCNSFPQLKDHPCSAASELLLSNSDCIQVREATNTEQQGCNLLPFHTKAQNYTDFTFTWTS